MIATNGGPKCSNCGHGDFLVAWHGPLMHAVCEKCKHCLCCATNQTTSAPDLEARIAALEKRLDAMEAALQPAPSQASSLWEDFKKYSLLSPMKWPELTVPTPDAVDACSNYKSLPEDMPTPSLVATNAIRQFFGTTPESDTPVVREKP